VPTPEGPVRLKIPPGTQPGRRFRLKGRGMPTGSGTRGDFFAELSLVLPDELSSEERIHWEALAKLGTA